MAHDIFDSITAEQQEKLTVYEQLLRTYNQKVNLVSRESEAYIRDHHLRHVLAFSVRSFPAGCSVVDWGTGGGLPAIPVAVIFPDAHVVAVDSVGKKVQAVQAMARRIGLNNLEAWNGRAETWPGKADYSISRATAPLVDLWSWHANVRTDLRIAMEGEWTPGLVCLKGGNLTAEIQELNAAFPDVHVKLSELEPLLGLDYYRDKYIVEVFD